MFTRIIIPVFSLAAISCSHAAAPLDLTSPFPKIALIKDKSGKVEEREAQSVTELEDKVELHYASGGVGLFPKNTFVAILPRLPINESQASPEEIDQIIYFLESLPDELRDRQEASPETLQRWKALKLKAEETLDSKNQTNKNNRETRKDEDAKTKIVELFTRQEYEDTKTEAQAFIKKYPNSPYLIQITLILARTYDYLDNPAQSLIYAKTVKRISSDAEVNGLADQIIKDALEKQGNMTSASSLKKYQGQPLTIVEMQNLLPVGMTQQEVVAIMGPPNHEVPSMNSWVYMKKVRNPITGNLSSLWIKFSTDGRVVQVKTV